jgi:hypothetical protein
LPLLFRFFHSGDSEGGLRTAFFSSIAAVIRLRQGQGLALRLSCKASNLSNTRFIGVKPGTQCCPVLHSLNTYKKQQTPLKSACFYLLHYAGAIACCVWKKSIFSY